MLLNGTCSFSIQSTVRPMTVLARHIEDRSSRVDWLSRTKISRDSFARQFVFPPEVMPD